MKSVDICLLVSWVAFCSQASGQTGIISTVAGGGYSGLGDGGLATSASLLAPASVAVDASGNLFIADTDHNRVRKVSGNGIITTVAGGGAFETDYLGISFSGDGGPATSASLYVPSGVAVDGSGNLFIADSGNNRIRKVSASGIITTVAGGVVYAYPYPGDGGPATSATLRGPEGVAVDASGNLFIADSYNGLIRKVSASGIITTVAGNGTQGFSGDGGPATSASLAGPLGVAVDGSGNLFFADSINNRIRKVSTSGIITTVVGSGATGLYTGGFSGDGGPATSALLFAPSAVAVDGFGNLFISDSGNYRIRKVSSGGIITTIAGGLGNALYGDGGPATSAGLSPSGVAVDASGNILIADSGDNRIREVATVAASLTVAPNTLKFSLFAGSSSSQQISLAGAAGSPWSASASVNWITLSAPSGTAPGMLAVVVNAASLLPGAYTASIAILNKLPSLPQETIVSVSLTVNPGLSVAPSVVNLQVAPGAPPQTQALQIGGAAGATWQATVATGTAWLSVSPGAGQIPAPLTARVNAANLTTGIYQGSITVQAPGAIPPSSTIYITLTVGAVSGQGGIVTTVAGNGSRSFSGDGGLATSASLSGPSTVVVDGSGNILIADGGNNRIRKVSPSGIITTVAGGGNGGLGDGGPATEAWLADPCCVAVDGSGNLFISSNQRIREVSASGIITTVVGGNDIGIYGGFSGDGGPAASAELYNPLGVAVDGSGNLFIADWGNNRIRKVSSNGIITTVAGNGLPGFSGDNVPATSTALSSPRRVAVDGSGNLFIADTGNQRIRKVSASGIITTVAGNGNGGTSGGFSGDGGLAIYASLYNPTGVAVDGSGNLFIADTGNNRIRKVSASGTITTVVGGGSADPSTDGPATSASLYNPNGIAVDVSGNLFIADTDWGRIREAPAPVPPPSVPANGVTDGAGFSARISGGGIGSIFGTNLAAGTTLASSVPLPTKLAGTTVMMNGIAVPLFFVSPGQINFQVPWEMLSSPIATLTVTTAGGTSPPVTLILLPAAPGIFTINTANSAKQGVIQIANTTTFVAPVGAIPSADSRPATTGDNLTIYCSGLGTVTKTPPSGSAAGSGNALSNVQEPVSVTIGGKSALFQFAGLSPGYVGLYQVNVQLPAGVAPGTAVPVIVTTANLNSNTATIAVQ
jgi:uncharacterized protein (TIGR03437 family)